MSKKPIQSVFHKVERDLVKVSSRQSAESVHRFRSAARRLETLLAELVPEQERPHRKLLKALGRIRKRAGKLRDLDVQVAALRSLKVPQEPRRKSQLMNSLIELRAEHEKKLRKALNKQDIRDTRKRLKRAAKDVKSATVANPLAVARKMLGQPPDPQARGTLTGKLTEDLLHHYRVISKRARYIAELAPPSAEATYPADARCCCRSDTTHPQSAPPASWDRLARRAGLRRRSIRQLCASFRPVCCPR